MVRELWLIAAAAGVVGCYDGLGPEYDFESAGGTAPSANDSGDGDDDDSGGDSDDDPNANAPAAPRAQLRRLTRSQYAHTVQELLGATIEIPEALEPDLVVDLFATVGAAQGAVSSLGAEQYEAAADELAGQIFDDAARRSELVGCDPAAVACLETFVATFGRRAFRRALTEDETDRYITLADDVAAGRDDPWEGARAVVIALLSSPSLLYQVEIGEPDPDDDERRRFTSVEMASRIAYALWNGPPDEDLLSAGEAGELVEPKKIRAQARRLLADPRARRGIHRFISEWLALDPVPNLSKDETAFPNATPELFASMHGEATRLAEHAALDGSMKDLLSGTHTYVDAKLAEFYGVPAPTDVDADGFGRIEVPPSRAGILGTAAMLAMSSRRTRTAPTLRGLFVQSRLRCKEPPPPPADVQMDIPDETGQASTIRELLEEHRKNPSCATCHALIDPPGLALENFDALGSHRTKDAGQTVDARTSIDNADIDGLEQLAEFLAADQDVTRCIVRQLHRFTVGHREVKRETKALNALAETLAEHDYNLTEFIPELLAVTSFRTLATQ